MKGRGSEKERKSPAGLERKKTLDRRPARGQRKRSPRVKTHRHRTGPKGLHQGRALKSTTTRGAGEAKWLTLKGGPVRVWKAGPVQTGGWQEGGGRGGGKTVGNSQDLRCPNMSTQGWGGEKDLS